LAESGQVWDANVYRILEEKSVANSEEITHYYTAWENGGAPRTKASIPPQEVKNELLPDIFGLRFPRFGNSTASRSFAQIVPFSFEGLFQQFTVDIWAQIEQDLPNWNRYNQNRLRADLYDRIEDAITRNPAEKWPRIGRRVIFPSPF
jgi:hypothetical protein